MWVFPKNIVVTSKNCSDERKTYWIRTQPWGKILLFVKNTSIFMFRTFFNRRICFAKILPKRVQNLYEIRIWNYDHSTLINELNVNKLFSVQFCSVMLMAWCIWTFNKELSLVPVLTYPFCQVPLLEKIAEHVTAKRQFASTFVVQKSQCVSRFTTEMSRRVGRLSFQIVQMIMVLVEISIIPVIVALRK